jgi:hypothetical protein
MNGIIGVSVRIRDERAEGIPERQGSGTNWRCRRTKRQVVV